MRVTYYTLCAEQIILYTNARLHLRMQQKSPQITTCTYKVFIIIMQSMYIPTHLVGRSYGEQRREDSTEKAFLRD